MPGNKTKQAAKRRMANILHHLESAVTLLAVEHEVFAPQHPELAELLEIAGKECLIVQTQLEDFWRTAWGELPESIQSWL